MVETECYLIWAGCEIRLQFSPLHSLGVKQTCIHPCVGWLVVPHVYLRDVRVVLMYRIGHPLSVRLLVGDSLCEHVRDFQLHHSPEDFIF